MRLWRTWWQISALRWKTGNRNVKKIDNRNVKKTGNRNVKKTNNGNVKQREAMGQTGGLEPGEEKGLERSMAEKFKETAVVLSQERIGEQIYSMWIRTKQIAGLAKPGQFISIYCHEESRMLPRPISICETDRETGALRVVYRVAGKGTEEFSAYQAGDSVEILGPLGNGYPLERCKEGRKAFLIGGGIGIPPMVQLSKELEGQVQSVMGYRDQVFLEKELAVNGPVYIATEDGSRGTKGNVLDCIRENGLTADVIFACGPTPMLRAIKAYAAEQGIECWISMEERMACGIGACLACVCQSKEIDDHSQVHNKRICKEGPVFLADSVEL